MAAKVKWIPNWPTYRDPRATGPSIASRMRDRLDRHGQTPEVIRQTALELGTEYDQVDMGDRVEYWFPDGSHITTPPLPKERT